MEQTMKINQLPSPTWGFLGVNGAVCPAPAEEKTRHRVGAEESALFFGQNGQRNAEAQLCVAGGTERTLFVTAAAEKTTHAALSLHLEAGARLHVFALLTAEENASLAHKIRAVCEENALLTLHTILLGKGDLYSDCEVTLKGDGSSFRAEYGYLGTAAQKIDMNLVVLQHGKRTAAQIDARGALCDRAEKIFRGTIDFKRGCADSRAAENETVLLLGEDVINKTVPVILCAEENVDGSHGASIGELDEQSLFYFASRGIDAETAKRMLARAAILRILHAMPQGAFYDACAAALQKASGGEENDAS